MNLEKVFQQFIEHAQCVGLPIEGIAVGNEDRVLMEHHFTPDRIRNIYSHTKSHTSTAVGIALGEGKLSLTDRLADFFPEYVPDDPDPALFRITLRHLLTMSSGFGAPYLMQADRSIRTGYNGVPACRSGGRCTMSGRRKF